MTSSHTACPEFRFSEQKVGWKFTFSLFSFRLKSVEGQKSKPLTRVFHLEFISASLLSSSPLLHLQLSIPISRPNSSHHVHRPGGRAAVFFRQHQSHRRRAAPKAGRDGRRTLLVATVHPQPGRLRPVCCVEPGVSPLPHRKAAKWDLLHRWREASLWTSRALRVLQQRLGRAGLHPEETLPASPRYTHTTRHL